MMHDESMKFFSCGEAIFSTTFLKTATVKLIAIKAPHFPFIFLPKRKNLVIVKAFLDCNFYITVL